MVYKLEAIIIFEGEIMPKSLTIRVPPWLSEDEARRIIESLLARLGGRLDVEEVRKILGIRPEELTENLETYGVEELRDKEKGRVA